MRSTMYWSPRVTLPYKPHIGTLSYSPEIDSVNTSRTTMTTGPCRTLGPGSITYPARPHQRALFLVIRTPVRGWRVCMAPRSKYRLTTIQVDVVKGWTAEWPRPGNGGCHHGHWQCLTPWRMPRVSPIAS